MCDAVDQTSLMIEEITGSARSIRARLYGDWNEEPGVQGG